jgi:chorismate-pyruvate lyase
MYKMLHKLIELGDSTTLFLESERGDRLRLKVESQVEMELSSRCVIRRIVKLFFDSPDNPLLYCISYIDRDKLSQAEYKSLMEEELPIGIVFHSFNEPDEIRKRNVSITKEVNQDLALSLNVKSNTIFKKKYDYWVGDREIGCINEYFNEESLERVCTTRSISI